MGKMQRDKGARIEREAAKFLTLLGFPAERNARNGIHAGDLLVPSLPTIFFEVKGDESIDLGTEALNNAIDQALETCGPEHLVCAVLWKKSRTVWRLSWIESTDGPSVVMTVAGWDVKPILQKMARECGKVTNAEAQAVH